MEYGKLVKRSVDIVWQNKFLIMYNASLNEQKDAAVIINKSQVVWVMEQTSNR